MLQVVLPLSFIQRALIIAKNSLSMCLSLFPLALIDITISVSHSTKSMKESAFSLALVFGLVWKYYSTKAPPFYFSCWLFVPVTDVHSAIANIVRVVVPSKVLIRVLLQDLIYLWFIQHWPLWIDRFPNSLYIVWFFEI